MKDNSSVLLQLKTIYSLVTSSQLKQKLFRLPSAQAKKFVKLLMSILKRQVSSSSFLSSFLILSSYIFYFGQKDFFFYQGFLSRILTTYKTAGEGKGPFFIPLYHFHPIKFQFWHFWVLWWIFVKFLMSFSKQQASFSSNSASLCNVLRDNSSVLF